MSLVWYESNNVFFRRLTGASVINKFRNNIVDTLRRIYAALAIPK